MRGTMDINAIFDPDNAVWSFLLKLYYLAFAGLLWIVCSLPIITIGCATSALYSYCFAVLEGREAYVLRTYLSAFRRTFKQSTLGFLLMAALAAFLTFDAYFFLQFAPSLFFVALGLFLIVLLFSTQFFALTAIMHTSFSKLVHITFIMTFKHAATSLTVLLCFFLFLTLLYFFPITILFSAGPLCMLASLFLRSLYQREQIWDASIFIAKV